MRTKILKFNDSKEFIAKWYYKIIIAILILIPILTGVIVLYRFISPFGLDVNYNFNIADDAELFGKINNVNRSANVVINGDKLQVTDKFTITKEQVDFSVVPIVSDFKTLSFNINFGPLTNNSTLLQLQNAKTKANDNFLINNVNLNKLGNSDYTYNGYQVWAFNPNLKTAAELENKITSLTSSSNSIETCTLDNSFFIDPVIKSDEALAAPKVYPQILRGSHKIDVFVGNDGILYFSLNKQELNWYSGDDTTTIQLLNHGNIIRTDIMPDDGIYDGKFGRAPGVPEKYTVNMTNLTSGVYEINIISNDDVLFSNIASKNPKIVINKDVFLANSSIYGVNSSSVSLFTYAPRLFLTLYHDASNQIITVNKDKYSLETLQNFDSLDLSKNQLNTITFKQGDVRISSKDYYALDTDSYFKPSVVDEINCLNLPYDAVTQQDILVVKNIATKNSDGSYTVNIPFKSDYIDSNGFIHFSIYNPGLGSDQNRVDLNSLSVEMIK